MQCNVKCKCHAGSNESHNECHAGSKFDDKTHMQFMVACRRRSRAWGPRPRALMKDTHTHIDVQIYVYAVYVLRLYDINGKPENRGVRSQIR